MSIMIEVENLGFSYPGQTVETIRGISFSIPKGTIYGFLGPSGAGKSTTQKILTRLVGGYTGNAIVKGKKLKDWNNGYFNHIGVGFELPNHYAKLTGLENLKLFASLYDVPAISLMELLRRVGLEQAANQKTEDYSKGMKMRLNFARALVHNPEILFFDEPTSGLDPVNARNLKNIIKELKAQGKTIFVTTHNMYDADELCDRVAFISNGRIMADDSPKALKLKYGKPLISIEYRNDGLKNCEMSLENLGGNNDFLHIISHYDIISMHTREASLDEVFVITTGQELTQIEG
jgi:fluoroquinolone transport system ATP-binding protein